MKPIPAHSLDTSYLAMDHHTQIVPQVRQHDSNIGQYNTASSFPCQVLPTVSPHPLLLWHCGHNANNYQKVEPTLSSQSTNSISSSAHYVATDRSRKVDRSRKAIIFKPISPSALMDVWYCWLGVYEEEGKKVDQSWKWDAEWYGRFETRWQKETITVW